MNNKENNPENNEQSSQKKSLIVAIQEVASLLRKEVKVTTTLKLNEKQAKILSSEMLGPSIRNQIGQVAKLLREQASQRPSKKALEDS